jgi:hypothetical protein
MENFIIAQDNETGFRENFKFGLKIGAKCKCLRLTWKNIYADRKLGLATGAFLSIPISKYIGVQPEILISQKGYKNVWYQMTFGYRF